MFQMSCSNCSELIKSPVLVEVQVVECPHCKEIVGVMNVAVATRTPTINLRSSLKKVLSAAKDNFRTNKTQVLADQTSYDIDKRLAKLLRRDDFRLDVSYDLYVQINYETNKRLARLLNISPSGAGVEFSERSRDPVSPAVINSQLPEGGSEVSLLLPLPGDAEPLSLSGKVVWSRPPTKETILPSIPMGVKFKDIDETTRECLWDFIVNSETVDFG